MVVIFEFGNTKLQLLGDFFIALFDVSNFCDIFAGQ